MQTVIHEMSSIVPLPKFDLFGVPPTQAMIESDIVTEHRPITSLDPSSFIQFEIQSAIDEYIDLEKLYLMLKVKVKNMDNLKIDQSTDGWDEISPVNNFLHSIIRQLDIFIGDTQISSTTPTYAYKAYFETFLGFNRDAKNSHLSSALWFNDENHKVNDPLMNQNTFIKAYRTVDLYGRLFTDLSFQGRALLGGCKLIIRVLLNEPNFYFMAKKFKPELDFVEATLNVHRAKVPQMLVDAHNIALSHGNAKYPITMSNVKTFTIAKGSFDANIDNVHSGQLPRRIFVAFVNNLAYCGSYELNPFIFQHYNVSSLAVYLDGQQFPAKAFTPDFQKNIYQREMHSLYEALDMLDTDSNFAINRNNYNDGNTIYGFNFAPDLSSGCGAAGHVNPIRYGSLRLSIRFGEATPTPVTVLIYCEFDKILEVDIARKAQIDLF